MTDFDLLRRVLEPRGLWNADGVGRKARARSCKACGKAVMVGLDDDRAACPAKCDPTPLTAMGEAVALLAGLATYSLTWRGGHYEIDHRTPERIKGKPAGSVLHTDVLAEHKCGRAVSAEMRAPSRTDEAVRRSITKGSPDDVPPF